MALGRSKSARPTRSRARRKSRPSKPTQRTPDRKAIALFFSPGGLSAVAPREGAPLGARLDVWNAVPGLSTGIACSAGDNLEITVSAEMYQATGSIWFRALVDGEVAEPSDVVFKSGAVNFDGVRNFTFVKQNISPGQHLVEIQWRTGTPASIRDRTLMVHSASPFAGRDHLAVAIAPSGKLIETSSSNYLDIPGMSASIGAPESATLAIVFSAEAFAKRDARLMVRALVDGTQVGEVVFCEGGDPGRGGTHSFTFARSLLSAGNHQIRLQWKSTGGPCQLGDRTMAVSAAHFSAQRTMASQPGTANILRTGTWTNLPPFSLINALDPLSTLSITFSGEVWSNKGRLFLRVLVDNVPASPADVTLIEGGSRWRVASHTFIVKNLRAGVHRIAVQAMVDPGTKAQVRRSSIRTLWSRRSGSDFVQPFLGMAPLVRTYRLLVVGFDPIRPGHPRPPFRMIKATFEGEDLPFINGLPAAAYRFPIFYKGPNVRDWLAENSGGVARIGEVRYVGCFDDHWYVAPPERQGNWYWNNGAFAQMWQDALAAADADVNFHSFDTDHNNRLETDDLIVAIVRPQSGPYGTLRGTTAILDSHPTPLSMPILDLYLSADPANMLTGVGITCHELCHLIAGAADLYGSCAQIDPGYYSIMDNHSKATHLDPFEKMKNGMVAPIAIDLTLQGTITISLPSVERHRQILLLHHSDRVEQEYFIIENRFPGTGIYNYDRPLGAGAIVVWQIFEDINLVQNSAVCAGDPRFIRRRATLTTAGETFELAWADGTASGFHRSPKTNSQYRCSTMSVGQMHYSAGFIRNTPCK